MLEILFYTLGCKVNQYETQAMRELMEEAGCHTAGYGDEDTGNENSLAADPAEYAQPYADAVVVNSCTVTGESDRKLRQLLRRIRRDHPDAAVVLTGCMPQAFPDAAAAFPQADIVLGNGARRDLPSHISRFFATREKIVDITPHSRELEALEIRRFQGRTRAFVKIEDGCDRFCSYCIVPYARGRVRSKPLAELRRELEELADGGYAEVVLAGINLTAYGQEWNMSLCDAVDQACGVSGLLRVRLGSLEPDVLDDAAIARLAAQPKLCPQFHLSLQSGCASTLKRMNRRYTPKQYADVCEKLRTAFPGCALTTDIMVGFPGEDETEFAESMDFVQSIGFARAHVFAYSPRPGTPAAAAGGQLSAAVKSARSRKMISLCDSLRDRYIDNAAGSTADVLLETNARGEWEGYTPQYMPVRIKNFPDGFTPERGQIVSVHITGHTDGMCEGSVIF